MILNEILKKNNKYHLEQVDDYLAHHKIESDKNENTDKLKQRFESKIDDWLFLASETSFSFNKRKANEPIIPDIESEQIMLKELILKEIESFKKQEPYFYEELFLCCNRIRNNTTFARSKQQEEKLEQVKSEKHLFKINISGQANLTHRVDYGVEVYDVLDELLKHKEEEFRMILISLIEEKGIKNNKDWYSYISITRQDFSKYISGRHPSRDNALKLAFGLKLSLEETQTFLNTAGYSLGFSCQRDIIIRFCIEKKMKPNETDNILMHYNEKILFG